MRLVLVPSFLAAFLLCLTVNANAIKPQNRDQSCLSIYENILIAHFVDCNARPDDNVKRDFTFVFGFANDVCQSTRQIVACAANDYVPCPYNVTDNSTATNCYSYLSNVQKNGNGAFDFQKSVKTFLSQSQYSAYDPKKNMPPFALVYTSSYPANQNGFIDALNSLHNAGYEVLIVSNPLSLETVNLYMRALPQSNLGSDKTPSYLYVQDWVYNRINARFTVPTVNQTGLSGAFTTPNYPNAPPPLTLQEFYVAAPDDSYTITFNIVDIATGPFDEFVCWNGKVMSDDTFWHMWGRNMYKDMNFTSPASAISCRFDGQHDPTGNRGFSIAWYAVPKN